MDKLKLDIDKIKSKRIKYISTEEALKDVIPIVLRPSDDADELTKPPAFEDWYNEELVKRCAEYYDVPKDEAEWLLKQAANVPPCKLSSLRASEITECYFAKINSQSP